MAFSKTSDSPVTYVADGPSELLLVDQRSDVVIDGSDENDTIRVNSDALPASALINYDVRGFAGEDNIDFFSALIKDSVINGNIGDDTMRVEAESLSGSYFLGGKGNDTVTAIGVSDGEVNGNIGDDTVNVFTGDGGFNMYVGGGQGNDVITVSGAFENSIIDGNKGTDTIDVRFGNHSNSSVNGGEGDDIIRADGSFGGATTGLVINGDLGNDYIVSTAAGSSTVNGGEGNDTIVSVSDAGQNSTVDAGVGADVVVLEDNGVSSAGRETYVFDSGDSVAATKTSFAGVPGQYFLGIGDTITFGDGVDLIQSFGAGNDVIDIDFTPANAAGVIDVGNDGGIPPLPNSLLTNTLSANTIYEVYGNYNGATQVFTVGTEAGSFNPDGTAIGDGAAIYIIGGQNLTLGQVFTNSSNMIITNQDLDISDFV